MSVQTGRDLYETEHPRSESAGAGQDSAKGKGKRPTSGIQRGRDMHTHGSGVQYDN